MRQESLPNTPEQIRFLRQCHEAMHLPRLKMIRAWKVSGFDIKTHPALIHRCIKRGYLEETYCGPALVKYRVADWVKKFVHKMCANGDITVTTKGCSGKVD